MSLAEGTEVGWPPYCSGEEVPFLGGNVVEVLDSTGKGGDSCCGTVGVRNFLSGVGEKWQSDFVGVAIECGKEDPELGASGLGLRGGRGSGRAAF